MVIRGHKLSPASTILLIVDAIILIAFLLLPWISINFGYNVLASASGLTLPFRIFGLTSTLNEYAYLSSDIASSISAPLMIVGVISIAFYTIPIFAGIALFFLFVQVDEKKFDLYSRIACICAIVAPVIIILLRSIILNTLTVDDSYGEFGSVINAGIRSIFNIGYGTYIELITGLVGLVVPFLIKSKKTNKQKVLDENKSGVSNVSVLPKEEMHESHQINSSQNLPPEVSVPKTPPQEVNTLVLEESLTQEEVPKIQNPHSILRLSGEGEEIDIPTLPSVLGRNVQEADITIFNPTVSRRHCQFLLYESILLVQDLGSTYGTELVGEKLIPQKFYRIKDGDYIRIGETGYTISINEEQLIKESDIDASKNSDQLGVSSFDETIKMTPKPPEKNSEEVFAQEESLFKEQPESVQSASEDVIDLNTYEEPVTSPPPVTPPEGLGKTLKLNYNGGQTRFPTMALNGASEYFLIDKTPFIIGSDVNKVDHVIQKFGVSKQHFKIHRENDQFYITDLNSKNGVRVNGQLIQSSIPSKLEVGDRIALCGEEYVFENA